MRRCKICIMWIVLLCIIVFLLYLLKPSINTRKRSETILLVTAISNKPCKGSLGDYTHIQSIENKLKYCRIKNFSFHLNTVQIDPLLSHAWNKIAVVHRLLEENLNYDWIMWMDIDTLILNMTFDIPLQDYRDYDFVLRGDENRLYNHSDVLLGLNSGIFLIRNNPWGKQFFGRVLNMSKYGRQKMAAEFSGYTEHLSDQNTIAYLLYNDMTVRNRSYFEKRYDLNGYWEFTRTRKNWNPFILHFAGCEFCDGIYAASRKDCFPLWNHYFNQSNGAFPT